jgi:acyl dehydratase
MRFEEYQIGQQWTTATYEVTEAEILEFAGRYDPQPLHVDHARAAAGPFGGLIAPGLLTLSIAFRLWLDVGVQGDDGRAGLGMDGLRWLRPVRPGQVVQGHIRVADLRRSSKGQGIVTTETVLRAVPSNEELLSFRCVGMVASDGGAPA